MKNLRNIEYYGKDFKEYFLADAEKEITIDNAMKPLYDAINSIDDLVVIESSEGELNLINEDDNITYLKIVVLNNNYELANNLFGYLKNSFGSMIDCNINFMTNDKILIDEDDKYANFIGVDEMKITITYNIIFVDIQNWIVDATYIINRAAKEITDFGKKYNKKFTSKIKVFNKR